MRLPSLVMAAIAAATMPGCAGSTLGSGVGDRFLAQPPYYAGAVPAASLRVGHLPIVYQRGGGFEPRAGAGTPLALLVSDMNARLDAMGHSLRLPGATLAGTPPDVSFGCELDATGDCVAIQDLSDRHAKRLRLAVARPSGPWLAAARERAAAAGVGALLVITLEIGQYWVHQRDLLGTKEVRLGTGRVQPVPWLTSLEAPLQVVQLTGVLVGVDGRAIRIGAEGLLARRTDLVMSGLGAQALIRDDDIRAIREQGEWEEALDALVRSLR